MNSIFKSLGIIILTLFLIQNNAKSNLNVYSIPLIGDIAPSFIAQSTKGEIKFPDDYKGKWVIIFSHPADFTPVCTSELIGFAEMEDEFEKLNCKLLGLSVDGISSHIHWIHEIEGMEYKGKKNIKIDYPLISDNFLDISKKFGMIQQHASSMRTIRGVYIIDDKQVIQAILMYPINTGRNIKEILRLVEALQTSADDEVATPEGWKHGDDIFIRPAVDGESAMDRYRNQGDNYYCPIWFMCIKPGKK